MVSRGPTTEDITEWLKPAQALKILEAGFGDRHTALDELKERLRGGMVLAACHTTTIDGDLIKAGVLNQIGSDDWDRVYSDNAVWTTGTLTIAGGYRASGSYSSAKTIRFFDVRFHPGHINRILGQHQQKASPPRPRRLPQLPLGLLLWYYTLWQSQIR